MLKKLLLSTTLLLGVALGGCDDDDEDSQERFRALLSGPNSSASGTAEFVLDDENNTMSYTLTVQNITDAQAAHIHGPAGPGENAGVLVSLFPTASSSAPVTGTLSASGTFADAQINGMTMSALLELLRNENAYVNVHTAANPGGEIRGQIGPRR